MDPSLPDAIAETHRHLKDHLEQLSTALKPFESSLKTAERLLHSSRLTRENFPTLLQAFQSKCLNPPKTKEKDAINKFATFVTDSATAISYCLEHDSKSRSLLWYHLSGFSSFHVLFTTLAALGEQLLAVSNQPDFTSKRPEHMRSFDTFRRLTGVQYLLARIYSDRNTFFPNQPDDQKATLKPIWRLFLDHIAKIPTNIKWSDQTLRVSFADQLRWISWPVSLTL